MVLGLAADYCVGSTTIDAQVLGLPATLLQDATRGVAKDSTFNMMEKVKRNGGRIASWEEWQADEWGRARHVAETMVAAATAEALKGAAAGAAAAAATGAALGILQSILLLVLVRM